MIKRHGGIAVVQDPEDALYPGMPRSAAEHVDVDHSVPLPKMGALLTELLRRPAAEETMSKSLDPAAADRDAILLERYEPRGEPSAFTCPECSGSLSEIKDGALIRYRCRIGHGYTADTLLADHAEQLEAALWTALRALEEHGALARRMAGSATERGRTHAASLFTEQSMDAERHASIIRGVLHDDHREQAVPDATG